MSSELYRRILREGRPRFVVRSVGCVLSFYQNPTYLSIYLSKDGSPQFMYVNSEERRKGRETRGDKQRIQSICGGAVPLVVCSGARGGLLGVRRALVLAPSRRLGAEEGRRQGVEVRRQASGQYSFGALFTCRAAFLRMAPHMAPYTWPQQARCAACGAPCTCAFHFC